MPYNISNGAQKSIKLLLRTTDLHGCKYLVENSRKLYERLLWLFIQIMALSVTVYLILNYWNSFMENPTLTEKISAINPVDNVPFPAVSICNLNKISKSKLVPVREFLISENLSYNLTWKLLNILGLFFEYDISNSEYLFTFQKLLEQYQIQVKNKTKFNTEEFLYSLITPCGKLLKVCKWGSKTVPCKELFNLRLTFDGHCCTFNYVKARSPAEKKYPDATKKKTINHQRFGVDNGLSVIINNNLEDYFYSTMAIIGINVHIFHPDDYPDKNSGSLTETFVPMASETFIELNPTLIVADKSIMKFPFEKRRCVFASERTTYLGDYSQSDCFVDCRVKSFIALCECVPYTLPTYSNVDICTLADVPCLSKFNDKWKTTYPYDSNEKDLSKELQNGITCDEICYSACELSVFRVSSYSLPLRNGTNETILHIYYPLQHSKVFQIDCVYYWYEILSCFGGLFGITMGLSIVSVIEVIWFFSYKWGTLYNCSRVFSSVPIRI